MIALLSYLCIVPNRQRIRPNGAFASDVWAELRCRTGIMKGFTLLNDITDINVEAGVPLSEHSCSITVPSKYCISECASDINEFVPYPHVKHYESYPHMEEFETKVHVEGPKCVLEEQEILIDSEREHHLAIMRKRRARRAMSGSLSKRTLSERYSDSEEEEHNLPNLESLSMRHLRRRAGKRTKIVDPASFVFSSGIDRH
ncbi:hypothetical protein F5Y15DRAFT_327283 [Xylariaceae sp. FL0016]|nr:hypothetical protein F5Y15DRAFT_327283 [Xylariaceae sp. FL0016]